jgi:ubiquitin-protein ligase E3 A
MYHVIGMILGLAIYNNTLLELRFPMILYQKLLAPEHYQFEHVHDLAQVEPDFYNSFKYILKTTEPLESMELTFEATTEIYGEKFNY